MGPHSADLPPIQSVRSASPKRPVNCPLTSVLSLKFVEEIGNRFSSHVQRSVEMRTGRPLVPLSVTADQRSTLEKLGSPSQDGAGSGVCAQRSFWPVPRARQTERL